MIEVLKEDISSITKEQCISWDEFDQKTFFITGGTGLIGFMLVAALLQAQIDHNITVRLVLLVRNRAAAKIRLQLLIDEFGENSIQFVTGNVENLVDTGFRKIDYIIHCASNTSSEAMISSPVQTIETAVTGTRNILELAQQNDVESMVYLSSMEVYGNAAKGKVLVEEDVGAFDPKAIRNCYPISKIMSEALCQACFKEYETPVKVMRLGQTVGLFTHKNDKRLFAYLLNCITGGESITLKTSGSSEHSYIYITDAIVGILCVLQKGKSGEIYNCANDDTYSSIRSVVEAVARKFHSELIILDEKADKYPHDHYIRMDVQKITKLGWKAKIDIETIIEKMGRLLTYTAGRNT